MNLAQQEQLLDSLRATFPPDHPDVLKATAFLAMLNFALHRNEVARVEGLEVIRIFAGSKLRKLRDKCLKSFSRKFFSRH